MAGFQIGDLFAKIGFDTTEVKQKIAQVKSDVERFKNDIERSLAKIASPGAFKGLNQAVAGIQAGTKAASANLKGFAAQAKQSTASVAASLAGTGRAFKSLASERTLEGLSSQFAQARAGLRSLATAAEGARLGLLNRQENARIAASIGTGLRAAVDNIGAGFLSLGRAATTGLGLLKTAALAPINAFNSLLSSVLSIRTALAGFGVFKLFERAGEVDNLRNAFDNLAQSIGAVSGNFLRKLQVATRGTVSELELLRLTNNAVLLGVAKTSDQFAELAEAARRLGQATGRTTSQAIEDLALGIGRQSRQLLDNLGIIIKVGEAYTRFAQSVGKSTFELTDAERRTAFFNEAMRKVRERVAALGPDVETVGQAFQRLTATFSNIFTDLSRTLVSRGTLVSIADFFDRNRPRISAFVGFIRDRISQIVDALIKGVERLKSGDLNFQEFLDATFGAFIKFGLQTATSIVKNVVPVMLKAGVLLGKSFVEGVGRAIRSGGADIFTEIQTLALKITGKGDQNTRTALVTILDKTIDDADKGIVRLKKLVSKETFADLERRSQEFQKVFIGFFNEVDAANQAARDAVKRGLPVPETDVEERLREFVSQVKSFRDEIQSIVDKPEQDAESRELFNAINDAAAKSAQELEKISGRASKALKKSLGDLTGDMAGAADRFERDGGRFREAIRDSLTGFRPINVSKVIQPFADMVNGIVRIRADFLEKFGKFIPDSVVQKSANAVNLLAKAIEFANEKIVELNKAPETLDPQDFSRIFDEFQGRLRDLKFDELTAGASAGARAVAELDKAFKGLNLDAAQRHEVDAMADSLRGLASAAEAAQAVAGFQERIENLGLSEGEQIAKRIRQSIVDLQKTSAFSADPVEIQLAINDLEFERQFDPDNPEIKEAINSLHIELTRAVNVQDAVSKLKDELEKIDLLEGRARFEGLTKDLTTSIFQGIAEGFERGESAAKIWSGIVSDIFRQSMQRVIDGLTTTISKALGEVFGSLGLGFGAADLATGLIGVGSAILVGLRNKQQQTVADFSQQVNSSEAIRGVVAGPTNVAISKVGDQLKFALRTVESQLERIAVAVERGTGTGGTTGAPFSTRLTSSTPT